ncbi:hypothetical protein FACS1894195_5550 [Bacteroidia bacterium]|nr:hypothetical protein FACS1894195_5550 [Bacteroidia bacterium]
MPKPSYTLDTLKRLTQLYPEEQFSIVMGEDNLRDFHLWRGYEEICAHYPIWVYPRPKVRATVTYPNVTRISAPLIAVSSTDIRTKIRAGKDTSGMLPECINEDVQTLLYHLFCPIVSPLL